MGADTGHPPELPPATLDDVLSGRRIAAATRMEPLAHTGYPDPDDPRPSRYAPDPITAAVELDWADTVEHLRALGYDVAFAVPAEVRAAWPRHAREVRRMQRMRRDLAADGRVVS